jgi:hypothetical protein
MAGPAEWSSDDGVKRGDRGQCEHRVARIERSEIRELTETRIPDVALLCVLLFANSEASLVPIERSKTLRRSPKHRR